MRLRHPDGTTVHLAYCSNVHPAEDLAGIIAQLSTYADPIRRRLDWPTIGVGLWLAEPAARLLDADPAAVADLRAAITAAGCEVVTLNGFPYAGFHDPVVKQAVYHPDWTTTARREHTLRLARVLTALLPDDVAGGSISTLPLGWREGFDDAAVAASVAELAGLAEDLADLEAQTGRRIAIAVEPEPGCRVETVAQLADVLGPRPAHPADPARTPTAPGEDGGWWGATHLGACLDLAHLAVQFEDADQAIATLDRAGIPVHKAQVSAALRVPRPANALYRAAATPFADSPFLHQTRTTTDDGHVIGVDDLHEALDGGLADDREWRVHFHLPLHQGGPDSTQAELLDSLRALVGGPTCRTPHLEVETYTWSVLPPGRRPADADDPVSGLVAGIANELEWTASALGDLGLHPIS